MDPTQRRNAATKRKDATQPRNAATQREGTTGGHVGRALLQSRRNTGGHDFSRAAIAQRLPLCHPERSEGSVFEFRCSSSRPWILGFDLQLSTVNLRIPHGSRTTSQVLTQPPANALGGARHAVPLFHFRLSTVDCRLALAYFAAGFSGLNTPCGLSFQIQAWTSHGVFATKCPPFALQSASLRL
jgi:hypothetical protein